jgi:tetratricopeptide (TPR) repeat protein|tara:strand:- start:540 stop:986 length:447 start_codon:yes stop_codon:yes gene_type:complete
MKKILITILVSFIVSTSYSAGTDSGNETNYGKDFKSAIKLISKKKYDNAIEKLMDLVDVSSSDFTKADVLNEIGFAFRKNNDLDNASKYYLMALKEDPNHLGALEYQGEMFVDLGQKDKALANLNKLKDLVGEKNSFYKELDSYISRN